MPLESVRYVEGDVGGGFGARGEFYPEDFVIPWLAIELGAPDQVGRGSPREPDRPEPLARAGLGARDGRRRRRQAARASAPAAIFNQGAYARTHGCVLLPLLLDQQLPGPYRWGSYEIAVSSVLTNKTPAGTYRGPGQYEPNFIRERMVDLIADELGLDPVEIRRRNLVTPDDLPYKSGLKDLDTGKPVSYVDGDYPATFDRVLERIEYEKLRAEIDARAGPRARRSASASRPSSSSATPGSSSSRAWSPSPTGASPPTSASPRWARASRPCSPRSRPTGSGSRSSASLISYHDTDVVPEGQGAFSSRATVWGGHAICGAIDDLIDRGPRGGGRAARHRRRRSRLRGRGRDPHRRARRRRDPARRARGRGRVPLRARTIESDILMGANAAVVRIDPESGQIEILRYVISYEVGRAINPLTLEGQVRGAAAQGIGGTLLEEFVYDAEGQPLSASFMDYAMATAAEIPDIEVILVELGEANPDSPLGGAKGGGEGGIIAIAPTLCNAISDALGREGDRLTSLPITPERICKRRAATSGRAAQPYSLTHFSSQTSGFSIHWAWL